MGVDPLQAVLSLLLHPGVAHIELGGLDILHRAGHGLLIGLVGDVLDRQEGHGLLDDQLLVHPQLIHDHVGVEDGQLIGPHVQGVSDGVEGVPLLHHIGGLLHPHLGQSGPDGRQVEPGVGGQLHRGDLHVLHELIADGVLGEVRGGGLVQQGLQLLLSGGAAQLGAVHPQAVRLDQGAHVLEQSLFDLGGVTELAGDHVHRGHRDLGVEGVVFPQDIRGPGLHVADDGLHVVLAGHHAQLLAVVVHGVGPGVGGAEGGDAHHHREQGHIQQGGHGVVLHHVPDLPPGGADLVPAVGGEVAHPLPALSTKGAHALGGPSGPLPHRLLLRPPACGPGLVQRGLGLRRQGLGLEALLPGPVLGGPGLRRFPLRLLLGGLGLLDIFSPGAGLFPAPALQRLVPAGLPLHLGGLVMACLGLLHETSLLLSWYLCKRDGNRKIGKELQNGYRHMVHHFPPSVNPQIFLSLGGRPI